MPFRFNVLGAALGIIAAAAIVSPGRAQQYPSSPGQEPVRGGRTASVTANVNLRSGPGTDSEIITTIPAGSTVRVASCSAEWCEVTWNGRGGYAIARSLSSGSPRHARTYGPQPDYTRGYGPGRQLGYPEEYGPGRQPGYTEGYGPRRQPGYPEEYGPGRQPGYTEGYGPRRQPGYPEEYGPGRQPGYTEGYGPEPPAVYEEPGYYAPPAFVYGPAYYGPGFYYGPGWGWRRRW
jgi:uncharacterized protein YraI